MNETCSVCGLPARAALEEQIRKGASVRALARHYHLGRDTIARHKASHMTVALVTPTAVASHQATPESTPVRTVPNETDVCRYCFKHYPWFINYRGKWQHDCGREWDGPTS